MYNSSDINKAVTSWQSPQPELITNTPSTSMPVPSDVRNTALIGNPAPSRFLPAPAHFNPLPVEPATFLPERPLQLANIERIGSSVHPLNLSFPQPIDLALTTPVQSLSTAEIICQPETRRSVSSRPIKKRLSELAEMSPIHGALASTSQSGAQAPVSRLVEIYPAYHSSDVASTSTARPPSIMMTNDVDDSAAVQQDLPYDPSMQHQVLFSTVASSTALSANFISLNRLFALTTTELSEFNEFTRMAEFMSIHGFTGLSCAQMNQQLEMASATADNLNLLNDIKKAHKINDSFRRYLNDIFNYLAPTMYPPQAAGGIACPDENSINQMIEVLEHRFYQSSPLVTLLASCVGRNLERVDILAKNFDPQTLEVLTQQHLTPNYLFRFDIILTHLTVGRLIIGDSPESANVNQGDIPFGFRGLSVEFIEQLLRDETISNRRLELICLYACNQLKEITQTGELRIEWMRSFSDPSLELFFASQQDVINETYHHRMALPEAIKLIARFVYDGQYDHNQLGYFLQWISETVKISGDIDNLAYMLFENSIGDKQFFFNVAKSIYQVSTEGAESDRKRMMEAVEGDIRDFCIYKLSTGHFPRLDAHRTVVAKFNNLDRQYILKYISVISQTSLTLQNSKYGTIGYYDKSGIFHSQKINPLNEVIIRPDHLCRKTPGVNQEDIYQLTVRDNHDVITNLVYMLREKLPFAKKNTETLLFTLEQNMIANYPRLPGLAPQPEAGPSHAIIERVDINRPQ